MPATVNSTVGSCGMRLADGTTGEIATAPIPLRVVSLLPKEKSDQKLAYVRGPIGVALGRAFWVGVVLLALLLGALVWWIARRRRQQVPALVQAEPSIPADEEARRALDALAASGRLARAENPSQIAARQLEVSRISHALRRAEELPSDVAAAIEGAG